MPQTQDSSWNPGQVSVVKLPPTDDGYAVLLFVFQRGVDGEYSTLFRSPSGQVENGEGAAFQVLLTNDVCIPSVQLSVEFTGDTRFSCSDEKD